MKHIIEIIVTEVTTGKWNWQIDRNGGMYTNSRDSVPMSIEQAKGCVAFELNEMLESDFQYYGDESFDGYDITWKVTNIKGEWL